MHQANEPGARVVSEAVAGAPLTDTLGAELRGKAAYVAPRLERLGSVAKVALISGTNTAFLPPG